MDIWIINPWICDFAAFDLWARPLGLLTIAARLREIGYNVHFIDCLDTSAPELLAHKRPPIFKKYGTSKYYKEEIGKPEALRHVQRRFSRYGLPPLTLRKRLMALPRPSLILMGSMMTYWYPGIQETVHLLREVAMGTPIVLGGIYATLCEGHAKRYSGADLVIPGPGLHGLLDLMKSLGIFPRSPARRYHPYPAYDLLSRWDALAIRTSRGCPFNCTYCASKFLYPTFLWVESEKVIAEIRYWRETYGVRDFAFYDDALLFRPDIDEFLEKLCQLELGLRFHTPNALHASRIDTKRASLLRAAGFKTIRLGLESHRKTHWPHDNKLYQEDFASACEALYLAGFKPHELGAYILMGLPGQDPKDVLETIGYAKANGMPPYLSEYSPIPHTRLWEEALRVSNYPLKDEPLYHNNSLIPCWPNFSLEGLKELKEAAVGARRALIDPKGH